MLPIGGAAAASWADVEACSKLAQDSARLACYDRALPPPADASAGGKATPSGQATAATGAVTEPDTGAAKTVSVKPPAASAPADSTPKGAAASAQVSARSSVAADFGLPQKPAFDRPEVLESSVAGAFDGWGPDQQIRLSNGQVWRISDGSSAGYTLRDPKVRITRGSFGTFFMQIEGVSQTPKVRRVR